MLLYLMSFVNLYVFNLEIAEWMCVIIIIIYSPSMRVKYTNVSHFKKKKNLNVEIIFFSFLKYTREDGTRAIVEKTLTVMVFIINIGLGYIGE